MDRTDSPVADLFAPAVPADRDGPGRAGLDAVLDGLTDWDEVGRRVRAGNRDEVTRLLGLRHPDVLIRRWAVSGRGLTPRVLSVASWDPRMEIRMVAACHPRTPSADLLELARDRSKFVRADVAANPSAPLLARLAPAGEDGVPTGVEPAVGRGAVPVMAALLDDEHNGVRIALARRPDLPLAWIRRLARDPDREVRGALARATNRSDVLITLASARRSRDARWAVAGNEAAPAAALDAVVRLGRAWERFLVFENPNAPEALLRRLAADPDPEVRRRVVTSPRATDEMVAAYATDPDPLVRLRLAESPRASAESLTVLATDKDLRCRYAVVRHPSAPLEALELLAAGRSPYVRRAVAHHPAVSRALLERLAEDRDDGVRAVALQHLGDLDPVTATAEDRSGTRSNEEAA